MVLSTYILHINDVKFESICGPEGCSLNAHTENEPVHTIIHNTHPTDVDGHAENFKNLLDRDREEFPEWLRRSMDATFYVELGKIVMKMANPVQFLTWNRDLRR